MNVPLFAALFKFAPVGKNHIIALFQSRAKLLREKPTDVSMDEACTYLVAAGFFSMELHDFKRAASIAGDLENIHCWYTLQKSTPAQKMRAHANALLIRTGLRIFESPKEDLTIMYDALQQALSLVIVKSGKYGKGWKLGQLQAAQLQLYLDWVVLGEKDPQTWRTVKALHESSLGSKKFETAAQGWLFRTGSDWKDFVAVICTIVKDDASMLDHYINPKKN